MHAKPARASRGVRHRLPRFPLNAHPHWLAAETAAERKDWTTSESHYRRALDIDARHVPSMIGLSTLLSRRGMHRESHALAMQAAGLQPAMAPLAYALAQRLRSFHEFEALDQTLSRSDIARVAPLTIVAKSVVMLSSIGAHDHAIAMAEQGLRRDPRHAALLFVRGNLHFFDGQPEEAEACYERSLVADPKLLQNSWMLSATRAQTPERNHVARIRRQLATATPQGQGEGYLCFALHKELHDLGDYPGAWEALAQGCRVKRRHVEHVAADDDALLAALERTCTPAFLDARSTVGQPATPIFIVGMHRSGTTLLERMLSGHGDVHDAGETCAFDAEMQLATDYTTLNRIDATLVERAARADVDAVARGYARRSAWLSKGKPFFTEKLPSNFWNLGFIAKALPRARVIHLVRAPMDTCFSNLRTLFAGVATYSYDQAELAAFYLKYRRMMQFWRDAIPGMVLDVRYEDLVSDPERQVARIVDHCGLEYLPGMTDVARPGGRVSTASAGLARDGIRRDRAQAWEPYAAQLAPMREILAALDDA